MKTLNISFTKAALFLTLVGTVVFTTCPAEAVVTDILRYDLGEPGSFVGQLPQDGIGTRHMTGSQGVVVPGGVLDVAAPGSIAATNYPTSNLGQFGASSAGLPTSNFAVEMWARTANPSQATGDLFEVNATVNGSLKFTIINGNWASSLDNVGWIGGNQGAGQAITPNTWVNLAVINSNGVNTLYIDGLAQAPTLNATPTVGGGLIHIGVNSGGQAGYEGDLDAIRMFTFDPNTDDPVAALSINNPVIPEPSTITLAALSLLSLGFVGWRRRRR